MKLNKLFLLSALLMAVSCQSTASSQRSVSVVGLVPMSGTSTSEGTVLGIPVSVDIDVERSGVGLRLENRDGAIGMGVELRQTTYEAPAFVNSGSDGIEIAGFFRRYTQDSNNSPFLEVSPILGLGQEDSTGAETSSYALLRLAAGYRWMLAETTFIDVDAGYYMTLMAMDTDTITSSLETDVSGVDIGIAIGFNF
jgi:hypothetical protein